ncbi:2'-5' RNA ligase family protein [Sphaerisporangium sp. NPDC051017]|uniref:2'-5' RNA ligase family protein n=1 Tax=Sphaerisporangium sp. NPDC051017 TaxID=3154636 RepID=UPI00343DBE6C
MDAETRDHWWWRPGWRRGRSFYTWHFLMDGQPELHEFVKHVRLALDELPMFDPIPIQWLHMTTQGVGFSDEVGEQELAALGAAVIRRVGDFGPLRVRLGPLCVDAEGVHLPVQPSEAVSAVRQSVRDGIGEAWGQDRVPEPAAGFFPHVSLAYANTSGSPLHPIRDILRRYGDAVPATLTRITLIDLNRDEGMYRWRTIMTAFLVKDQVEL